MATETIDLVLAVFKEPGRLAEWRERPLPEDVASVIRVAAGEAAALATAIESTGEERETLIEASVFFLQQILFTPHADSYRVLGAWSEAPQDRLRENYRWLMKWLHPDRNQDGWETVYADRVNVAWQDLKTVERRANYDQRAPAVMQLPVPVVAISPRIHAPPTRTQAGPLLSGSMVRRLPAIILGGLAVAASVVIGVMYWAQVQTEREVADRIGERPTVAQVQLPSANIDTSVATTEATETATIVAAMDQPDDATVAEETDPSSASTVTGTDGAIASATSAPGEVESGAPGATDQSLDELPAASDANTQIAAAAEITVAATEVAPPAPTVAAPVPVTLPSESVTSDVGIASAAPVAPAAAVPTAVTTPSIVAATPEVSPEDMRIPPPPAVLSLAPTVPVAPVAAAVPSAVPAPANSPAALAVAPAQNTPTVAPAAALPVKSEPASPVAAPTTLARVVAVEPPTPAPPVVAAAHPAVANATPQSTVSRAPAQTPVQQTGANPALRSGELAASTSSAPVASRSSTNASPAKSVAAVTPPPASVAPESRDRVAGVHSQPGAAAAPSPPAQTIAAQGEPPAAAPSPSAAASPAVPATAQPVVPAAAQPVVAAPPAAADAKALVQEFVSAYAAGDVDRFNRLFSRGHSEPQALDQMRHRFANTEMRFLELQQLRFELSADSARASASYRDTYVLRGARRSVTEAGVMQWVIRLDAGDARIAALYRDAGQP